MTPAQASHVYIFKNHLTFSPDVQSNWFTLGSVCCNNLESIKLWATHAQFGKPRMENNRSDRIPLVVTPTVCQVWNGKRPAAARMRTYIGDKWSSTSGQRPKVTQALRKQPIRIGKFGRSGYTSTVQCIRARCGPAKMRMNALLMIHLNSFLSAVRRYGVAAPI